MKTVSSQASCLNDEASEAKLLDRVLARRELGHEDAQHADHGEPAIVDLLAAHIGVVHVDTERVAKVARAGAVLLAPRKLQDSRCEEQAEETKDALTGAECAQAPRCLLKAGKLQEVLAHEPDGRHHRHAAVLQLRRPELVVANLIAEEVKPSGSKKPSGSMAPSCSEGWKGGGGGGAAASSATTVAAAAARQIRRWRPARSTVRAPAATAAVPAALPTVASTTPAKLAP
eukprot:CAMPEP_0171170674 /NCGR_PEP_ID=MMETSP0790-20130122/8831_1 /TAXON_ID=2925 /ORGANISM="Alexandrium catenella, Strain OF101" /LENGTH=229 /DNA_ID=CAMNT_0011635519 /DNA_START=122 /DNA_END=813 /DNA_ORIENTATION=-